MIISWIFCQKWEICVFVLAIHVLNFKQIVNSLKQKCLYGILLYQQVVLLTY